MTIKYARIVPSDQTMYDACIAAANATREAGKLIDYKIATGYAGVKTFYLIFNDADPEVLPLLTLATTTHAADLKQYYTVTEANKHSNTRLHFSQSRDLAKSTQTLRQNTADDLRIVDLKQSIRDSPINDKTLSEIHDLTFQESQNYETQLETKLNIIHRYLDVLGLEHTEGTILVANESSIPVLLQSIGRQ